MKLFVCNLPFKLTSQELSSKFSKHGQVLSAKIVTDKLTSKSKGFGFVEMNDADAKEAIKYLDGTPIDGRNILVKEAIDKDRS